MIAVAWNEPQPEAPTVPPQPITMHVIIAQVAAQYGLTYTQILARRRHRPIVHARQYAMWRCQRETRASLPEIGRYFGGYDHTTVLHAIRAHEKRMGAGNGEA